MLNQPTPDIFQAMQNPQPQPQAPVTEAGNALFKPIAEGVQAMGDNVVALFEAALNKVVNLGAGALTAIGGGTQSDTGRYEDPGFTSAAPIIAAAAPAATKGQSIEAPQISAPSLDVSLAQLGDLIPTPVHFGIGPSQGQSQGIA